VGGTGFEARAETSLDRRGCVVAGIGIVSEGGGELRL
jgi:hypothetical protein